MGHHHSSNNVRWVISKLILTVGLLLLVLATLVGADASRVQKHPRKAGPAERATTTPTPADPFRELGPPPPAPVSIPKATPKLDEDIKPGDVISVETNEVVLPVTVRDANGHLVPDLTRKDFRVFEDGREQPLNDLALRQVPVDVVLMVDASSSVANNLDDFRRAVEGFASRLSPDDRISLIKFDDRVQLLQDWTQSRFQLRRALARIEPGMFTRFNDALLLAAKQQFAPTNSRRAIIVLTDGIDSGRGATAFETAVEALLQSQVVVYVVSNTQIERVAKQADLDAIARGSDSEVRFNQVRIDDLRLGLSIIDASEQKLSQLAQTTGGRLYKPTSFDMLDATYAEVAEELTHQYSLYYTPLNKERDGSFRRVRVETVSPANTATTRVGYFAPHN